MVVYCICTIINCNYIQRNAGNDSSFLDQDSSGVNHIKRLYCSILSSHPKIDYCKKEYDKEGYDRFGFDIIVAKKIIGSKYIQYDSDKD